MQLEVNYEVSKSRDKFDSIHILQHKTPEGVVARAPDQLADEVDHSPVDGFFDEQNQRQSADVKIRLFGQVNLKDCEV